MFHQKTFHIFCRYLTVILLFSIACGSPVDAKQQEKVLQKNQSQTVATGTHLIADLWGATTIETAEEIEEILHEAARISNSVDLGVKVHKFEPQGVTGIVLLAESHIAIHTWPEQGYVAVDIFTCGAGEMDPHAALTYLVKTFKVQEAWVHSLERGLSPQQNGEKKTKVEQSSNK